MITPRERDPQQWIDPWNPTDLSRLLEGPKSPESDRRSKLLSPSPSYDWIKRRSSRRAVTSGASERQPTMEPSSLSSGIVRDLLQRLHGSGYRVVRSTEPGTDCYGVILPERLEPLRQIIDGSRELIGQLIDAEDEDATEYLETTWHRSIRVVIAMSATFLRIYDVVPPLPRITQGPDGSFDIVWRSDHRKLVLNIPEHPEGVATFFGRDSGVNGGFIRGEFAENRNAGWLMTWLVH